MSQVVVAREQTHSTTEMELIEGAYQVTLAAKCFASCWLSLICNLSRGKHLWTVSPTVTSSGLFAYKPGTSYAYTQSFRSLMSSNTDTMDPMATNDSLVCRTPACVDAASLILEGLRPNWNGFREFRDACYNFAECE